MRNLYSISKQGQKKNEVKIGTTHSTDRNRTSSPKSPEFVHKFDTNFSIAGLGNGADIGGENLDFARNY